MGLARFIGVANRAVYVILVARALGAEAYGSLSVALAWTLTFLPLTTVGLGAYIVAELSTERAASQRVLNQTLSITIAGSLVAAAAAAAIGLWFETDPGTRLLIILFAVALSARGITRWTEFVFVAYERPIFTLRQETRFRLLELGGVALVLLAGAGAAAVAAVAAACWILQASTGLHLVRNRLAHHSIRPDFSAIRTLFVASLPLLTMQLFTEGLLQYPLLLARHILPDAETVGNVALALQALFMVSVAPWALVQVTMPALLRAHARRDGREIAFVEALFRATAVGTAALVIGAAALGPWLVPAILGQDYRLAGELLWLAMLMLGPFGLFISAGSWLLAGRRYRYAAFSAAVGLLTLFVAAWALIPALGPAGVFLSAAAAQFTAAMTRLIPLLRTEPQAFGIPTRNAFAVATAAAALYGTWAWAGWPVIPGCLLALGVLALGAFRWCLRQPERQLVLAVLTRRQAS